MYFWRNIITNLYQHRVINGMIVITLAMGLLFPLIQGTIIWNMHENEKLCSYSDPENRIVIDCYDSYTEPEELNRQIEDLSEDIANYGYITYYSTMIFTDKTMYMGSISGFTLSYLQLEGYRLESGRLPTQEELLAGKRVCLIKQTQNEERYHLSLGESLYIMGEAYEVIGFVTIPKMYGGIVIPYRCMEELVGENPYQLRISIQGAKELDGGLIRSRLHFADSIIEIAQGDDINIPYRASIRAQIKDRLGISGAIFLIALAGMVLILAGRTSEEYHLIGIKLSVGAGNGQVFREIAAENMIMMILAVLLDLVLYPFVIRYTGITSLYPGGSYICMLLLAVLIITILVSAIVYILTIKRHSVWIMLRSAK